MAHKCVRPGCGFYLPDYYLFPLCPWHGSPGRGPLKLAIAASLTVGIGGCWIYSKIRDSRKRKKVREQQQTWRRHHEAPAAKDLECTMDANDYPADVA